MWRRLFIALALGMLCGLGPFVRAESPAVVEAPVRVKIEVDMTELPEQADYGRKVQEVADKWYPIIVQMLPSDGFVPADHVVITFKKDRKGVASTSKDNITCSWPWFEKHPDDLGAVVHELTHVVQAYRKPGVPTWLTEGIADYIRWFNYEPENHRPHPRPDRARYNASYQTSAAFLFWTSQTYDKNLIVKLNAACRKGNYSADLWKDLTGKTVEDLGKEWKETLRAKQ